MSTTKDAWERFQTDMNSLGAELKRHYQDAPADSEKTAEINRSLEQLRDAADKVFTSLETASRDPEVRARTPGKRRARSDQRSARPSTKSATRSKRR